MKKKIIYVIIIIVIIVGGFIIVRDKYIIDPGNKIVMDNDNRVYPLELNFYENYYNGCFTLDNGACASLFSDHYYTGTYSEDYKFRLIKYNNDNNNRYLGYYVCKTYTCNLFTINFTEKVSIIYDGEVVIYNYETEDKIRTGLKFDKDEIEDLLNYRNVSLLNYDKKKGYNLVVTDTVNYKYNVYNVNKKKYLLDREYDFIEGIGKLYSVRDYDNNRTYIYDYENKVYDLEGVYSCSIYDELDKYIVCSNEEMDIMVIIDSDNYKLIKEIDGRSSLDVINDKIVLSSIYETDYKEQSIGIYDKELNFIKEITGVMYLNEINIQGESYYIGSIDSDMEIEYYQTMILDKDFNILFDTKKMGNKLFRVIVNDDDTLLIENNSKKIVYDVINNVIK